MTPKPTLVSLVAYPIHSVETMITQLRLQEQYCLRFARCLYDPNNQSLALLYRAAFDSCLQAEAPEGYAAPPRNKSNRESLARWSIVSLPLSGTGFGLGGSDPLSRRANLQRRRYRRPPILLPARDKG